MAVKMIVAVDRANAIGHKDGRLPWHIPSDLKRFKELTTGGTLLMGRTTFESLKRPDGLPNRTNYVLSRDPKQLVGRVGPNVRITDDMFAFASQYNGALDDLWLIGGASVYDRALDTGLVDEIYLTVVDTNSGALVSLKHDLAGWKHWITVQAKRDFFWFMSGIEDIHANGEAPAHTNIILKREVL